MEKVDGDREYKAEYFSDTILTDTDSSDVDSEFAAEFAAYEAKERCGEWYKKNTPERKPSDLIVDGDEKAAVVFYQNQSNLINPFKTVDYTGSLFARAITPMPKLVAKMVSHKDIKQYINEETGIGYPLHIAVSSFNISSIKENGKTKVTSLTYGNIESLRVLLTVAGRKVNQLHDDEMSGEKLTLLQAAVRGGSVAQVKELLNCQDIDITIPSSEGKIAEEYARASKPNKFYGKEELENSEEKNKLAREIKKLFEDFSKKSVHSPLSLTQ